MSPAYAVLCVAVALLAAHFGQRLAGPIQPQIPRNESIDGLRGLLAVLVFISHAAVWYGYRKTGRWESPLSVTYAYMAQASVSAFFMATAFMFGQKLLKARSEGLDWVSLYVSRFLRLAPVYLLAMFLLFAITYSVGRHISNADTATPLSAYLAWTAFSIPGRPDLHGVASTEIVMAGVTWTLPYAWIFYFSLPILAWIMRARTSLLALLLGAAMIGWIVSSVTHYGIIYLMFCIGIAAAWLVGVDWLRHWLRPPLGSPIAIGCVALAAWSSPTTAYAILPIAFIGAAFLVIACGNNLWGLLQTKAFQTLGLGTYSLYLLHGPILFVGIKTAADVFGAPLDDAKVFWGVVLLLTPCTVIASLLSYRWIEAPTLRIAPLVSQFLSEWLHKSKSTRRLDH